MLKTVLMWLGIVIVLLLVLLWFITGGVGKTIQAARGMGNSLSLIFWSGTTTGSTFRLPWQPDIGLGVEINEIPDSSGREEQLTPEEELRRSQKEYDELQKRLQAAKTFGEPSPYRGKVRISEGGASETPPKEYIHMEVTSETTAPISLGGWSLQSAPTGIRAYIPRGSNLFVLNDVNPVSDIILNPGALAIVSSGASPLGVSFRENKCTGYLGSLQTFTPALSRSCPPSAESLPLTPENVRTYGDQCFDFIQELPPCTFPRDVPDTISPACRIFLSNTLSYNGCFAKYRQESDFARNSWRIYLNAPGELWRNTHDVIRLLDADGKTVDVISY